MAPVTPHLRVYYGRILTVSAADNRNGPVFYTADGYASWGSQDYIKTAAIEASNIPAKDAVVLSAKVGDDCEIWRYAGGETKLYPKTLVIPFKNCASQNNSLTSPTRLAGSGGIGGDSPPGGGGSPGSPGGTPGGGTAIGGTN